MLKKLQLKFIALNMAIVAMALTVAFGAICYLTYSQDLASINSTMQSTLDRAASVRPDAYGGAGFIEAGLPDAFGGKAPGGPEGGFGSFEDFEGFEGGVVGLPDEGEIIPPEIGGMTRAQLTPIVTYAIDERGLAMPLSSFSTALIPDAYLEEAVLTALAAESDFGSIDDLGMLYGKRVAGDVAYLAFADASAVAGWKELAFTLALVGSIALVAFLIISVFFSRWALRPVEKAWSQQQQFVADASHELKTPLTVILANTAILRGHSDESVASQSQWIESTQVEAKRMQALVNDMLELTQLDAEKAGGDGFAPVDFSDLVEAEILQFESVAFELGLSIEGDISPAVRVKGDATRLQRMVRVLVDNACKYADAGSAIKVRLSRGSRGARLEVANAGAPIAAEDLTRIFDRFYRADKSRTRETGGHGLGLSIASEIARAHGGEIVAESTAQKGTVFTVELPLG